MSRSGTVSGAGLAGVRPILDLIRAGMLDGAARELRLRYDDCLRRGVEADRALKLAHLLLLASENRRDPCTKQGTLTETGGAGDD